MLGVAAIPIERTERMSISRRDRTRARRSRDRRDASTCRRSIARRWTATRSSPRTRSAPAATSRRCCAASRQVFTGAVPSRALVARRVHRDRHRRADARRRRRGRDGRGNREGRRRATSACSRRSIRGSTSAAAAPTSRPARPLLARRRSCSTRAASARSPRSGVVDVDVYARPRVAILSTGNEIVEPGQPLGPGQIYDINRFTLAAIVGEHGGVAGARRRRRRTTSPELAARDRIGRGEPTSSCSRAAARSASAT